MAIRKLSNLDSSGNLKIYQSAKDAKVLPLIFEFSSFGDTKGLFYYLGKLNTGTWSNPHTSGQIRVIFTDISTSTNEVSDLPLAAVNRTPSHLTTNGTSSGKFILFDVGLNRKFNLFNITIQHSNKYNNFFLRNFKIRGSNNVIHHPNPPYAIQSATWEDLAIFTNNTFINSVSGWGNFPIPQTTPYKKYRWIQIFTTGTDSTGGGFNYLMLGEVELYGKLFLD